MEEMSRHDSVKPQITLPDIEKMPNKPSELPLDVHGMAEKSYRFIMNPDNGVLAADEKGMQYFGAFLEGKSRELITYGCVVTGLILRGEDTGELLRSLQTFYHEGPGLFLNSPSNSEAKGRHRIEYWYLMDVSALAYAIMRLKMTGDTTITEIWKKSVETLINMAHSINYDFNEQGFLFSENRPFTVKDIYRQPDSIAGYSYLMLFAYEVFKEEKYLDEAKKAMDLYLSFDTTPWYEIPNGAMGCLAAARLNSLGYSYDIGKAMNFAFDSRIGSMILGQWGGREVNGLMIGWRGDTREQAISSVYSMESMVALPYVLPVARYDSRFARAIGKYALNVIANIRLFYSDYLPEDSQTRPDLDPSITYERLLKEKDGKSPFGTGDAAGHKSIYGGGYILWWDAVIKPTNDKYIVGLDTAKTDFLKGDTYPTYLYYNPHCECTSIEISTGDSPVDIYDTVSRKFLKYCVTGQVDMDLAPDTAYVVVLTPSGAKAEVKDGRLYVDGIIVDYMYKA